ncbi:MAG: DUF3109 family protein [Bacteroidota bacterium]|nr:DUF3109 family protein [Bacteroidota bacterium]MDP4190081.1 DUF3109 family protein [Bacteroidota bacterium]MDP4193696.1 DUF3109 family protein [Bacteroidota bacterium]
MYLDHIFKIDDVLLNREITDVKFVCDLCKCKGACCTMESEYGAPLLKEEIDIIEKTLPIVKEYLPKEHVEEIEKNGFWEEKSGELLTRSLNDRACVFVYYENDGIAKCAIEKAYKDGKISFIKPISCHLFPIRVSKFGGDILRYEKINECEMALENGSKLNVTIAEFCKDSLLRLYGKKWYNKLSGEVKK